MTLLIRINDSALGRWERPTLAWLALRIPARTVPDHLTTLGILGALTTATGYILSQRSLAWLWLASAGLCLNWFGDSLDGTLARLRGIERPKYGFFIDHTSDLFCQSITFVALGISPLAHFGVSCAGLIVFLMAFVYTLITAQSRGTLRITYLHFGPSEIRALLLLGNFLTLMTGVVYLSPHLLGLSHVSIHDAAITMLSVAGVIMLSAFAVSDARALAIVDPPAPPQRQH